jgi:hypothetical protein
VATEDKRREFDAIAARLMAKGLQIINTLP